MKEIEVFTDGACRGNPGPGGWGVVLRFEGYVRELSGGEMNTTNNRMELTAAIRALESLKESCKVELFTDSVYVKDGITKWLSRWRVRGWRTSGNKLVKNQDLWVSLSSFLKILIYYFLPLLPPLQNHLLGCMSSLSLLILLRML